MVVGWGNVRWDNGALEHAGHAILRTGASRRLANGHLGRRFQIRARPIQQSPGSTTFSEIDRLQGAVGVAA